MFDGSDLDWLGLERTRPQRWSFVLTPSLSRFDGKFYGGTAIAVATAIMETETGRHAVFAEVQFASTTTRGARFDCAVELVAEGRSSSQLRVTGSVEDQLVFTALGATGRPRKGDLQAQFGTMPAVDDPEVCEPWRVAAMVKAPDDHPGWLALVDARRANEAGSMWMRMRDRSLSRPALGFLADVVPSGVVRAAGRMGAGTSLDNCVRFGPEPDGEWLLVDMDPHLISGGYVHGAARLWSQHGNLLGIASQSASLLLLD